MTALDKGCRLERGRSSPAMDIGLPVLQHIADTFSGLLLLIPEPELSWVRMNRTHEKDLPAPLSVEASDQVRRRAALKPSPSRPTPSRAKVAGSGTPGTIGGTYTPPTCELKSALAIMSFPLATY